MPGPEEERKWAERDRVVRRELRRIKGIGRTCVRLHDIEGRTLAETAARTGLSVDQVRLRRARALAVLKRRLQELGVRVLEQDSTPSPVWYGWASTGYDDDWTATVTANLPRGPDPLQGRAAKGRR